MLRKRNVDEAQKENVLNIKHSLQKLDYSDKNFVNTISSAIKTSKISAADLITASLVSSAKKRKASLTSFNDEKSTYSKTIFDHRKGGSYLEIDDDIDADDVIRSANFESIQTSPESTISSDHVTSVENMPYSNLDNNENESDNNQNDYTTLDDGTNPIPQQQAIPRPVDGATTTKDDQMTSLKEKAGLAVLHQLLHILNNGSFDMLLSLRGIGKTRAAGILAAREEGILFRCTLDLKYIGMAAWASKRLLQQNACAFLNLENI